MTGKRPAPSGESRDSKPHKRQKTRDARTISVQGTGPCRSETIKFTADSLTGLPGSIDVEKFAEARTFEIGAMQTAMQNTRDDSSKRVFQTLPRHLRRRTASHDVRRVPLRLRVKARAEMDPVKKKKKLKALAKRGKGGDIGRTEKLKKRQREKTWLETHIWHAKRMKMENLWGYRLALHPTEKSFRPSHRAAVHGSILQDVSYFGTLEMKGPITLLKKVLSLCCDPQVPCGSSRYTFGGRLCDTHIYQVGAYPFDIIGPCALLWKPDDTSTPAPSGETTIAPSKSDSHRVVWLRCHPGIFDAMHRAIVESATTIFQKVSSQTSQSYQESEIEIADLRKEINAFEIIGPKANQVLAGALKLTKEAELASRKVWRTLKDLRSTASVPRGMVLGLKVHDPRLSFPPVNEKPSEKNDHPIPAPAFTISPSPDISKSRLWDEAVRDAVRKPKYKKKDLDHRRSKNLVPGTRLRPIQDDNRVDIILIQRTISPSAMVSTATKPHKGSASYSSPNSQPPLHGWTILLPAGWSMPFFSTLTHTGTRVGGIREHQTQHFEASAPHFPRDYVTTLAYEAFWTKRGEEEKAKWERTPKAKRVPYGAIGIRSPWRADWEVVLGIDTSDGGGDGHRGGGGAGGDGGDGEGLIPTQPPQAMEDILHAMLGDGESNDQEEHPGSEEQTTKRETEQSEPIVRPWLLHGHDVQTLLDDMARTETAEESAAILFKRVSTLREKKGLESISTSPEALMKGGLVPVRIRICGRGTPGDLGAIYRNDLTGEDEVKWREEASRAMKGKRKEVWADHGMGDGDDANPLDAAPDPSSIIGYITSGHFSLQLGKGYGLGSVSLPQLVEIMRKDMKEGWKYPCKLVKVRSREGVMCRAACLEINSL
ncbi:hypothetical protein FRB96_005813 [Tulasnella sp. 330]|nr:hypothetical protein FRB96_005813 [Tulasnella sp. 330]